MIIGTTRIGMLLSVVLAVSPATADRRDLIERALDEPTKVVLDNVELLEAFEMVTEQTGVEIRMAPELLDLIPYGKETRVNAEIANVTLRQGLTDLVSPLGMTFVVMDDHVEIVPTEALLCLGRSATWTELDTLTWLSGMEPGIDPGALAALRERVQLQVPVPDAWGVLSAVIRNAGAGSGDEILTVACRSLGWAWCMSGDHIVVLALEQQIRRRLQTPVNVRMNNRPLFDVLRAIGLRAGVTVRAEPGALQSLPEQTRRSFSLNITQLSAEEVFDTISAYTGLGYLIDPDGVVFYRPENVQSPGGSGASGVAPSDTTTSRASDPYVAKIIVPLGDGRTAEWLIRASELPSDLLERRQRDIESFIEDVRRAGADATP